MRIELSVHAVGCDGVERSYEYSITFPDTTPLEQIEAHNKSMLRILDTQANVENPKDDDDDDDGDSWKQTQPPEKKAP